MMIRKSTALKYLLLQVVITSGVYSMSQSDINLHSAVTAGGGNSSTSGMIITGSIGQIGVSTDIGQEFRLHSGIIGNAFIVSQALSNEKSSQLPILFNINQNYPNPFNPISTILYDLPQASEVSLSVYDLLGREVAKLVNGYMEPGYHQAQWDGRDQNSRSLPSGIYIARLVTPEYTKSIKMVLLK